MMRPLMGITMAIALAASTPVAAQYSGPPRVPLVQDDTKDPDVQEEFKKLRARGTTPTNLHRTFNHAPKLARAISALAQALRFGSVVSRDDKELIILRASQLAHGNYQFEQHRPMAMSCGITAAQIESLSNWRNSNLFSDRQRAVLALADGMASDAGVDDATFDAMKKYFTTQEIVELTMNAAYYTASSQVSRTLRISAEGNPKGGSYGKCG